MSNLGVIDAMSNETIPNVTQFQSSSNNSKATLSNKYIVQRKASTFKHNFIHFSNLGETHLIFPHADSNTSWVERRFSLYFYDITHTFNDRRKVVKYAMF